MGAKQHAFAALVLGKSNSAFLQAGWLACVKDAFSSTVTDVVGLVNRTVSILADVVNASVFHQVNEIVYNLDNYR